MNAQLLEIKSTEVSTLFEILVLIGQEKHSFTIKIEEVPVDNKVLQVINGDENFETMFLFSPDVSAKIAKLVSKFYCQETVDLPAPVGDFRPMKHPKIGDFRPVNMEAMKLPKEENKEKENLPVAGLLE